MTTERPVWCLYHQHCLDGLASAAVIRRAFPTCECVGWQYGHPLPTMPLASNCFIVDVVPPAAWLNKLAQANDVTWIDHHSSALTIRDEIDFDQIGMSQIDTASCAATLAWRHMFPALPAPQILEHIEDKDLWRWRHPHSKAICAALKHELNEHTINQLWDLDLDQLNQTGTPLVRQEEQTCRKIAQRGLPCQDPYGRLGASALAVNNGDLISEVGELIYRPKHHNGLGYDLAIAFWMRFDGSWIHSLRSTTIDCNAIATARGGGGHRNAAAYTSDVPFPLSDDYLG